ncbi:MAG: glycosyltransferase family 4 protein [Candidatus Bathyarchaeia archaeon]
MKYSRTSMMNLKIVTNLAWPAFKNVALDIHKALKPYCDSSILDWKKAKPRGNVLFIETVREDTLRFLKKLPESNIVFYGTTEGHSLLDEELVELARKVKIVAVSNFVRQMLEEIGITVAGVVHHGVDMDAKEVDISFLRMVEEKARGKLVALTIASNDPRKGLEKLLQAYKIVEATVPNSFLILHSEPKRYYDREDGKYHERYFDLPEMASKLGIERIWLTNSYGMMSSEEVNALYKLCHIYVLSSFSEGFGLPMLESFRFDKPVVAVDAPPFNEIIEDGRTGKLIPYSEVRWFNYKNRILFKMHIYEHSSLAEAMINLLSEIDLQERMQAYIKEKKHGWSIHELYPKLLDYF